ncbi:hypothetical protein AGLY_014772 [Aphis glycines]|uniref:Uncharacterized protein n=1 Tax=Aphis glycines TaxID=307491 RepID=A0A6G0T2J1_APHGL|nr:hypothetical protein AGLY_014772 [Aphis glycines]
MDLKSICSQEFIQFMILNGVMNIPLTLTFGENFKLAFYLHGLIFKILRVENLKIISHRNLKHTPPFSPPIPGNKFNLVDTLMGKSKKFPIIKHKNNSSCFYGNKVINTAYCKLLYLCEEVEDCFTDNFMADKPDNSAITEFCDYLIDNYITNNSIFPPKIWAKQSSDRIHTTNACEKYSTEQINQYDYNKGLKCMTILSGLALSTEEIKSKNFSKIINTKLFINLSTSNYDSVTYITSTFDFGPCILPIIVPFLLFFTHPTISSSVLRSRQYLLKNMISAKESYVKKIYLVLFQILQTQLRRMNDLTLEVPWCMPKHKLRFTWNIFLALNQNKIKRSYSSRRTRRIQTGYGDVDNVVDEVMGDLLDAVLATLAGGDKPSSEKPDPQPVECTPLDQDCHPFR